MHPSSLYSASTGATRACGATPTACRPSGGWAALTVQWPTPERFGLPCPGLRTIAAQCVSRCRCRWKRWAHYGEALAAWTEPIYLPLCQSKTPASAAGLHCCKLWEKHSQRRVQSRCLKRTLLAPCHGQLGRRQWMEPGEACSGRRGGGWNGVGWRRAGRGDCRKCVGGMKIRWGQLCGGGPELGMERVLAVKKASLSLWCG